jgi:DNA repair exonuclease SbcCD nuclease subunit
MWKPSSSQYHALEVLKGKPLLNVVDSTSVLDGITYVPYLPDPKDWPDVVTRIAITHNTFKGADYGFKLASDGVSLDGLSCDLIASGHIHKPQSIQYGPLRTGRLIYPGSPMYLSAGDADQIKGLAILDSDTLETSFIRSPFPMWRTLDFYVGQESDLNINVTDRWVVKLIGPRAEIKAMLDSKEIKDLKRKVHVTFKTEFTDTLKSPKVSIEAPTVSMMADQYIDKIYVGSLDKDQLKSTIKPYVEKQ